MFLRYDLMENFLLKIFAMPDQMHIIGDHSKLQWMIILSKQNSVDYSRLILETESVFESWHWKRRDSLLNKMTTIQPGISLFPF